jgi:hypothetical protein
LRTLAASSCARGRAASTRSPLFGRRARRRGSRRGSTGARNSCRLRSRGARVLLTDMLWRQLPGSAPAHTHLAPGCAPAAASAAAPAAWPAGAREGGGALWEGGCGRAPWHHQASAAGQTANLAAAQPCGGTAHGHAHLLALLPVLRRSFEGRGEAGQGLQMRSFNMT